MMLELADIHTHYGDSQVLFGLSLKINHGEVVTLLGRNGMGKSTTIRSIMGLIPISSGTIHFHQKPIHSLPSFVIARHGIGLVPEGRQIFPNLTVRENIEATAANYTSSDTPYTLEDVLTIFPRLKERISNFGNQLSGGEQQMLAVARALMINPKLLILDEATEGLAPLVRKEIWRGIGILKAKGLAILIVDKNIKTLLEIADNHYIIEKGTITWNGTGEELKKRQDIQSRYLGV
jgi:branched-chain amino acid transport system ATP-binding protein